MAHYEFSLPVTMSGHTISVSEGSGIVGVKGSFWADPATYDIVRVSMEAVEIPPQLPVESSTTSIDYAHTNLGGNDFLLPQSADSRMVKFNGEDNRNHIEFTHCHLYGAESSICFGSQQGFPLFGASSVLEMARELLPALPVVVKVSSPITDKTAVGTLIEGVVGGNVPRKGKVLIPDGSPVRGRVRRLEWNDDKGGYFVVGLEFTEIEAAGERYRFFADLQRMDALPGLRQIIHAVTDGEVHAARRRRYDVCLRRYPLSLQPAGRRRVLRAARHLEIPPGFRMTWKTRALVP